MLQHETSSPAANVYSPRQKRLNSIQETLYSVDADQVPVVLQRLEEATSRPLQMLSNPVVSVVRKRGRPPGSKNRANQRDKSRFEYVSGNQCGGTGERDRHQHHSKTICKCEMTATGVGNGTGTNGSLPQLQADKKGS